MPERVARDAENREPRPVGKVSCVRAGLNPLDKLSHWEEGQAKVCGGNVAGMVGLPG